MGLFEQFPYTNFHELNLDWICRFVKKVRDRLDLIDKSVEDAQDARDESEAARDRSEAARDKSEEYSLESEAWAVGTNNGDPVATDAPQHENNSKWWSSEAADHAETAQLRADDAGESAYEADTAKVQAMKWANGSGTVPTDPQYENNSMYYAQQAAAAVNTALTPVIADIEDIKAKAWLNFFGVIVATGVVEKTPINGGSDIPGLFEFTIDDAPANSGYADWGDFQYQPEAWKIVGADSPTDSTVNHIFFPYNYSLGSHNGEKIFAVRVWDLTTGTWAVDGTIVSQFEVYLSQFTSYPYSTHGGRPINIYQ